MTARYAIYYAPTASDPLWRAGCAWLGRDPAGGPVDAAPPIPDIAAITADARLYGFHATLKPPMRLRPGVSRAALLEAVASVASGIPNFALPPLAVSSLGTFLCLRETAPSMALQAMSDALVAGLDMVREPPSEAELARRRAGGLSPAEDANLLRWGYPAVFGTWTFHMTLTRRLAPEQIRQIRPAAETWFAEALAQPRRVEDVTVFEQREAGAPFLLAARVRLGG